MQEDNAQFARIVDQEAAKNLKSGFLVDPLPKASSRAEITQS